MVLIYIIIIIYGTGTGYPVQYRVPVVLPCYICYRTGAARRVVCVKLKYIKYIIKYIKACYGLTVLDYIVY